jgi:hypothetical protein
MALTKITGEGVGAIDSLDVTGTGGQVTVDANGHITSKQSLDAITAGGRITGATNRGTVSQIELSQTASSADGGYIRFLTCDSGSTSPTERMRLLSGGGLTFNGDTATANALDDYEEGTWTPTLSGASTAGSITYQAQSGYYTKIGNIVHIDMRIIYTAFTGSAGAARIAGLPYNVSNATNYAPVSSNWMTFGNTFDTAGFPIFYGVVNADRFHGLVSNNNTAWSDWASSDFHLTSGTKYLNLTATYQTG